MSLFKTFLMASALLGPSASATERTYLYNGEVVTCPKGETGFTYRYNNDVFSNPIKGFECALTKHHLSELIKRRNTINGINVKNISIKFAKDVRGRAKPRLELSFT